MILEQVEAIQAFIIVLLGGAVSIAITVIAVWAAIYTISESGGFRLLVIILRFLWHFRWRFAGVILLMSLSALLSVYRTLWVWGIVYSVALAIAVVWLEWTYLNVPTSGVVQMGDEYYFIENGRKRRVKDQVSLAALGGQKRSQLIYELQLIRYLDGQDMPSIRDCAVLGGPDWPDPDVRQFVYWEGKLRHIPDLESRMAFGLGDPSRKLDREMFDLLDKGPDLPRIGDLG